MGRPTKFPLRGSDDLVDDPESAVAHAIEEIMPPEFQDVRCFFQLSASAGFVPGILKAHVFCWLSEPITDALLKVTMRQCAPRLRDYSVYQGVQPHYVAAPVVEGGPDPIPRRFGWIKGTEDPGFSNKPAGALDDQWIFGCEGVSAQCGIGAIFLSDALHGRRVRV